MTRQQRPTILIFPKFRIIRSEEAPAQADEFDAPTVELIDTAHVETGNAATATAALAMVVGFAAL